MPISIPTMARLPLAGVALVALGLSLAAVPARAQDPTYDGPGYDRTYPSGDERGYDHASYRDGDGDEIIIRARPLGRSSTTGAPIERVTTSRVVDYRDLDIDSPWGARELHYRIEHAARDACEELDDRYPIGEPDVRDCVSEAVRDAEHDVPHYDSDRDRY
jgi:UrcA family protein